ncbi:MAG: hypothetical protein ACXWCZ_12435 [Flavisolibacter sp.]
MFDRNKTTVRFQKNSCHYLFYFYDEEKVNQLYNAGTNYYICKPFIFEELKNVIQRDITLMRQNDVQPTKENFYINKPNPAL